MKKLLVAVVAAVVALSCVAAMTACVDDAIEPPEGYSVDGRKLNEIYDIDEYERGEYLVPYEVISESVMGKSMVEKYCVSTVKVTKSEDGFKLAIFIVDPSVMDNVRLVEDEVEITGASVNEFGYDGYEFEVSRGALDGEIAVRLFVSMVMQRDTNFGIKLDLSQAKLVA